MYDLSGRLTSEREGASFAGHHVQSSFTELVSLDGQAGGQYPIPSARTADVQADGTFTLHLPDRESMRDPWTVTVFAPSGDVLAYQTYDVANPPADIELGIDPQELRTITPLDDPFLGQTPKLTGRVVDAAGEQKASAVQVLLLGQPQGAAADDLVVLLAARTDADGYFFGDYPRATFASAYGVVADGKRIPLTLEQDGTLPLDVVLVAELPPATAPAPGEDVCDCHVPPTPRAPGNDELVTSGAYSTDLGGGRCVDFTVPNRALEEFSYYTVVRTTEPEIKGLSMEPRRYVPIDAVEPILRVALRQDERGRANGDGGGDGGAIMMREAMVARPNAAPEGGDAGGGNAAPPVGVERAALPAWAQPLRPAARAVAAGDRPVEIGPARGAGGGDEPPAAGDGGGNGGDGGAQLRIDSRVLARMMTDADEFTPRALMTAGRLTEFSEVSDLLTLGRRPIPGRGPLDADNPVDWDELPTSYQATTVAHGHLLHFKQVWRADGYSLGDLLYSLPLAPCQKKQIAVIDWDRSEIAARTEARTEEERLQQSLARDRDVSEIVNSALSESTRGGSHSDVSAFGGGLGIAIGPLVIGGGGATSSANSNAWQNSARDLSANSLQQIRDNTFQAASAVRGQRSTVVQTVRQGEAMRVETEVVANHNHCHAITVEYFEVLRHLQVSQDLADVQECLFVPLLMTFFDQAKALRWRVALRRWLRKRELAGGFDAIDRISTNWVNADFPVGTYDEEDLVYADGDLSISFVIPRPKDESDGSLKQDEWDPYVNAGLVDDAQTLFDAYLQGHKQARRDEIWESRIAPRIANRIVQRLTFTLHDDGGNSVSLPLDPSLVSTYRSDQPLMVTLRLDPTQGMPGWTRAQIFSFEIGLSVNVPSDVRMVVQRGSLRYRTDHLSHYLFSDWWIQNDLGENDTVIIPTPVDRWEERNPRQEDVDLAQRLVAHLNEYVEYYHQAIWWSMDPNRRYMLLDGFVAPNSGGRSVASVVENRLIGIVGNSLVLPVAPGFHLDPTIDQTQPVDLLNLYAPTTPIPPMRISVPTRGVFAEAVMGSCNSCEVKDDARFWRFEESPCDDDPTPIANVSTASRAQPEPDLTAKPFPTPMVNIQNAPAAPDPVGLGAAFQVLGKSNLFPDVTGLKGTQENALAAFKGVLGLSQFMGGEAAKLVQQEAMGQDIDKALGKIQKAQQDGLITKDQANQLANSALQGMIGEQRPPAKSPTDVPEVKKAIEKAANAPKSEVQVTQPTGSVSVKSGGGTAGTFDYDLADPVPLVAQPSPLTCWAATATMMLSWHDRRSYTIQGAMDRAGAEWRQKFDAGEGISGDDLVRLATAIGATHDAPMSFLPVHLLEILQRPSPVWVIGDQDMLQNNLVHARIVVGMHGDGTPGGTTVNILDPSGPTSYSEPFETFMARIEAPDAVDVGVEVLHF